MSVNYTVFGVGFVAGGVLNDSVGARWVWGGSAVVLAVAAAFAYALARGGEAEQPAGVREPEPAV